MRAIVLFFAVCICLLVVIYGTLLAWKPGLFLKFHDTVIDRTESHKQAEWRKDVDAPAGKILGIGFITCGLFMLVVS